MANSGIKVEVGDLVVNEHDAASSSVSGLYIDGVKVVGVQGSNIADLTAITGGESPTEAEHNLVVTKVNAILTALEAHGLLASA
jgi:hypothetical protein